MSSTSDKWGLFLADTAVTGVPTTGRAWKQDLDEAAEEPPKIIYKNSEGEVVATSTAVSQGATATSTAASKATTEATSASKTSTPASGNVNKLTKPTNVLNQAAANTKAKTLLSADNALE